MGRFGVQSGILMDWGWIWGSSWESLGDLWVHLLAIWGAKMAEKVKKVGALEGDRKKGVIRFHPRLPNVAPMQ